MTAGPIIPPGVGPVIIAVIIACLTTRWVVPLVLRMLATSLQGAVAMVAALVILPEYYVSSASRRRHVPPPQLAYDYGAAVGWLASLTHRIVGSLFRNLANAIGAIPMAVVAIVTGVLTTGWLLLGLFPV